MRGIRGNHLKTLMIMQESCWKHIMKKIQIQKKIKDLEKQQERARTKIGDRVREKRIDYFSFGFIIVSLSERYLVFCSLISNEATVGSPVLEWEVLLVVKPGSGNDTMWIG